MSAAKTINSNRRWTPTIENMPLGYFERLNQNLFMGLPLTVAALICTTIQVLGFEHVIHIGPELYIVLDFVTIFSLLGYVQLPFVLLISLLHGVERRIEMEEWAEHGYFREGFEPRGYDLSQLKQIHNTTIVQARLNKD